MGALVAGTWSSDEQWRRSKGRFVRENSQFRSWLNQADGAFQFEAGRYHLYVSYACPWAHRTMIARSLKGLESSIGLSRVEPLMLGNGWEFSDVKPDHLNGFEYAYQLYQHASSQYTGRVTVPILWDTHRETIVSNESSEIIRMLNRLGGDHADCPDLYPVEHQGEIDVVNERVYLTLNNGVYRSGFANSQEAYQEAVGEVFSTLDWLEERLNLDNFLVGKQLTEADIRLFPTLVRFDSVYFSHFKCSERRIVDYPNLWSYLKRLYAMESFHSTTDLDDIKLHYFGSHRMINPTGIIPSGPALEW